MGPLGAVRAIAFDMDETLIDFTASRRAGLEAALAQIAASGRRVPPEAFLRRHGELAAKEDALYLASGAWRPMEERFRILCGEFALPSDGFAKALGHTYTEGRFSHLRPYPETAATLRALRPRYPLFLVTNGPSASQHREIEVTGLAPFFNRLFVCEDFKMRKPDPRIFEKIREAAGVEPHEMLIVGDNPEADIDQPRRMGWRTVWVVRDQAARQAAPRSRADAVVASVADVPRLLGR